MRNLSRTRRSTSVAVLAVVTLFGVTGSPAVTSATAAAPSAGTPKVLWEVSYDGGPGHHDYGRQVTTAGRSVFVAASTQDRDHPADFTVLRYSRHGKLQWQRHVGGTFSRTGEPSDLLAIGTGVLVTGVTRDGAGNAALTTVRYDAHGHVRWQRRQALEDPVLPDDGPKLALADDGSIRVGASSGGDFLALSYASNGARQWVRRVDASGSGDVATDIAVDGAGNAYLAGPAGDGFDGYTTVKFDEAGHVEWSVNVHGPIGSTLGPAFVDIAPDGTPVVSASPESSCGVPQSRTWRLNPDGTEQWEMSYPADPCESMQSAGMHVRADGSVVVLGTGGASNADFATLSYSPAGELEWARSLDSGGTDLAAAIAVDEAGRAYVTGVAAIGQPDDDALTASYDREGHLRWQARTDVGSQSERPGGIALLDDGTVIVSGDYFDPDRLEDVFTLRYRQP